MSIRYRQKIIDDKVIDYYDLLIYEKCSEEEKKIYGVDQKLSKSTKQLPLYEVKFTDEGGIMWLVMIGHQLILKIKIRLSSL